MTNLFQDLRYGLRMLLKNPGFAAVGVITLALGIGANTALFSVADALLIHPLSLPDTDRAVMVMEVAPGQTDWNMVAPGNLEDWRQQSRSFETLAAGAWDSFNLTGAGDPQRVSGFEASANFFDTLRVKPLLGRVFLAGEDSSRHRDEVVLGYGLWERQFGADRRIVGHTIKLDSQSKTVIGVMPKGFSFPPSAELWVPSYLTDQAKSSRNAHFLEVLTRLKPGVSLQQAQAEMNGIAARLARAYPKTNQGWGVHVIPISVFATGDLTRAYTIMLLGAVGFVLLIVCANVANLQLARSAIRTREVAVKLSLGASRWRIMQQALSESLLLGLGGAALGLPLASWGVKLILDNMPADIARYIPAWDTIAVDWRAFSFALCIALLAGMISGLAPALQTSRVDLNEALKEGRRGGTTASSRHRLRSTFVISQITLSLVLLVGSGLIVKGVRTLISLTRDFSPGTILSLRLDLADAKYGNAQQVAAFYDRLLEQASSTPGVKSAAIATQLPFAEGGNLSFNVFSIEGRPALSAQDRHAAVLQRISPGYLSLMGIGLREGRLLNDDDTTSTLPVAVINQSMARHLWPDQSAVGHRLKIGTEESKGPWITIAGIVADVRNSWTNRGPEPTIYIPYRQSPRPSAAVALRTEGAPASVVASLRKRVSQLDAELPLYEVMPYEDLIHQSVLGLKYVAAMLSVMGAIALILAAVGLYGVMSYLVASRTHEIGIRMALGAHRGRVLRMTLRWGGSLVVAGSAIGVIAAIVLARLLASLLYGVSAGDLEIFAIATATLLGSALLATYVPARRATKVDPMVALRYE